MCVSNSVFCSETCIICVISGLCHSVNDIFTLGWDVPQRKLVVTDVSGLHCVISQKSNDHICTCYIYMFYLTNIHTLILLSGENLLSSHPCKNLHKNTKINVTFLIWKWIFVFYSQKEHVWLCLRTVFMYLPFSLITTGDAYLML